MKNTNKDINCSMGPPVVFGELSCDVRVEGIQLCRLSQQRVCPHITLNLTRFILKLLYWGTQIVNVLERIQGP